MKSIAIVACAAIALFATDARGQGRAVIDVPTRDTSIRILVEWPTTPQAVVALFSGGAGNAGINDTGEIRIARNNFAVRTRSLLHSHGIATAVVDKADDFPDDIRGRRGTVEHFKDIAAVIRHLRVRFGVPVWLHGTSRGTVSVANAASNLRKPPSAPDGVVFSASMLRLANTGNHVFDFHLDRIAIPVLIAHHRNDACSVTRARDVPRFVAELKAASPLKINFYEGGRKPISGPCSARHRHGFYGIEQRVLNDIATFILGPR